MDIKDEVHALGAHSMQAGNPQVSVEEAQAAVLDGAVVTGMQHSTVKRDAVHAIDDGLQLA